MTTREPIVCPECGGELVAEAEVTVQFRFNSRTGRIRLRPIPGNDARNAPITGLRCQECLILWDYQANEDDERVVLRITREFCT